MIINTLRSLSFRIKRNGSTVHEGKRQRSNVAKIMGSHLETPGERYADLNVRVKRREMMLEVMHQVL